MSYVCGYMNLSFIVHEILALCATKFIGRSKCKCLVLRTQFVTRESKVCSFVHPAYLHVGQFIYLSKISSIFQFIYQGAFGWRTRNRHAASLCQVSRQSLTERCTSIIFTMTDATSDVTVVETGTSMQMKTLLNGGKKAKAPTKHFLRSPAQSCLCGLF